MVPLLPREWERGSQMLAQRRMGGTFSERAASSGTYRRRFVSGEACAAATPWLVRLLSCPR